MKKLLLTCCIASGMIFTSITAVNAIELKTPAITGLKTTPTLTAKTSAKASAQNAANEKYKKEYQAKLAEQSKKLEAVKAYDKTARLELAKVILSNEQYNEIKNLKGEEQDTKLNEALVTTLSDEAFVQTYAEYNATQKAAYYNAAQKVQIADNRYKNVSNEITAPLKAIVDGDVSAISSKDELKNAAGLILGIKKNLGTNATVKKAIRKANKANEVIITVPEAERVIYPETGVVGSINKQLADVDHSVKGASHTLANILYTKEDLNSLNAIQNNKDLSASEKSAEYKKLAKETIDKSLADGSLQNRFDKMTPAQKKEYTDAVQKIMDGAASYTGIALACTKLGFNISRNPLIAAPLVFEVGALKDTGSLVKESAGDLTKSISQLKKINKAVGITIEQPTTASTSKIKPVNFLKK